MNLLFLNFLIYFSVFLFVYKRDKQISLMAFLFLFYSVIAFLGFYTVENGIYFDVFGKMNVHTLVFIPYFLCFISFCILFYPFRNLKQKKTNISVPNNSKTEIFVKIWLVYIVLFSILKLSEAVISVSIGLGQIYENRHMDGDTLFNYQNIILNKFNGYGTYLIDATIPFIIVYVVHNLKFRKMSNKKGLLLITLCFLPQLLNSIAMGSRGGIFLVFFNLIFFVLLFRKSLSKQFMKVIYSFGAIFLFIMISFSLDITSSRLGNKRDGIDSIFRYFGEAFPNLGFNIWDKVIYHPMGERLFPDFVSHNYKFYSIDDAYAFWENKTGVPVLNFKTLFGDLYIEFGILYAFIFLLILAIIMNLFITKRSLKFYNISYLYYYYQLCILGFAGFTKEGHNALFSLFIIVIVNIAIKYFLNNPNKSVKLTI